MYDFMSNANKKWIIIQNSRWNYSRIILIITNFNYELFYFMYFRSSNIKGYKFHDSKNTNRSLSSSNSVTSQIFWQLKPNLLHFKLQLFLGHYSIISDIRIFYRVLLTGLHSNRRPNSFFCWWIWDPRFAGSRGI